MMMQIRKGSLADVAVLIALSRCTIRASYRPFLGDEAVEAFVGSGAVEQYVADHLEQSTVSWPTALSWAMLSAQAT